MIPAMHKTIKPDIQILFFLKIQPIAVVNPEATKDNNNKPINAITGCIL